MTGEPAAPASSATGKLRRSRRETVTTARERVVVDLGIPKVCRVRAWPSRSAGTRCPGGPSRFVPREHVRGPYARAGAGCPRPRPPEPSTGRETSFGVTRTPSPTRRRAGRRAQRCAGRPKRPRRRRASHDRALAHPSARAAESFGVWRTSDVLESSTLRVQLQLCPAEPNWPPRDPSLLAPALRQYSRSRAGPGRIRHPPVTPAGDGPNAADVHRGATSAFPAGADMTWVCPFCVGDGDLA